MGINQLLKACCLILLLLSGCNSSKEELVDTIEALKSEVATLKQENTIFSNKLQKEENKFFEIKRPDEIPVKINDMLNEFSQYDEGLTSYFYWEGETYILLKAPVGLEISLSGVGYDSEKITVYYQLIKDDTRTLDYSHPKLFVMKGEHEVYFVEK